MSKQEVDINIIISIDNPKGSQKPESIPAEIEVNKLNVSLSVAQLAYLFRVLLEMGHIRNKKLSDVMRFICANVSTPKAEDISFDSLKAKYYNVDYSTKEYILQLLLDQLNYIKKDLNQ